MGCTTRSRSKYKRCIAKVKARGGGYNPYAVCSGVKKRESSTRPKRKR